MDICSRLRPCQRSGSGTCLQDTLKTSLCVNRLFPTARLSCKQIPNPSLRRRLPESCAIRDLTKCKPVQEVSGVYLQDLNMPGACYERTGMSRACPAGRHPAPPRYTVRITTQMSGDQKTSCLKRKPAEFSARFRADLRLQHAPRAIPLPRHPCVHD